MMTVSEFALFALLCVIVPCLVSGECHITTPLRCDLMSPKVVTNITFNGTCTNNSVIHLKMDCVYELNITFTPAVNADHAYSVVTAELPMGWEFPLTPDHPDACEGSVDGLTCPLKANTSYTAHFVLPIGDHSVYSTFPARIHWSLVNEPLQEPVGDTYYQHLIFCLRLDALMEPEAAMELEADVDDNNHDDDDDDDDDDVQLNFRIVP